MAPMITFQDFVEKSMDKPWVWGQTDCTIWAADWCILRWGLDPARDLRGTYSTSEEAERLIGGGLIELITPRLYWLRVKSTPEDGDLGIIPLADKQLAAVWFDDFWVFRKPSGIGMTKRTALKIWGD